MLTIFFCNLQLAFRSWGNRLELKRLQEKASYLDRQSLGFSDGLVQGFGIAEVQWLRTKLRKYPKWINGHIRLSAQALALRDLETAYASAQAVIALQGPNRSIAAQRLVAKCFLGRHQPQQAIAILRPVVEKHPNQPDLLEDLAAAYIALGDKAMARPLLERIPSQQRSPEVIAAISWCQNPETRP